METLPSGLKEIVSEDDGLSVRIYYLECLAQATYIITHNGCALIVDPRRDVEAFLKELDSENLKLKGVLETHFHADFVSGHYELFQRTNATIYFGPSAKKRCSFPCYEVKHEEIIDFTSRYAIKALHTPGHTPESTVYLVVDKMRDNKPLKAFTGDTLFIGSCGRPDLVGSIGYTAEEMAKMMFQSLRTKISTLPDDVQVFPAHGAGSPCGKNLSSDLYSTIGKEKLTNPALSYTDETEFVQYLTAGQPTTPQYFPYDVQLNVSGAPPLAEELSSIPKCSAEDFKKLVNEGQCIVLDTRDSQDFALGHIPNSLNFPLGAKGGTIVGPEDGNFAIWVGTLIPSDACCLLVNGVDKDSEAMQRLARIGYTKIKGVLSGGIQSYKNAGYPLSTIKWIRLDSGCQFESYLTGDTQLMDVRTEGEHQSNAAKGAVNMPLANLNALKETLNKDTTYITYCLGGYRSSIASSLLARGGFKVQDIKAGFAAISVYAPHMTTSGKICPSMKSLIEKMQKTS